MLCGSCFLISGLVPWVVPSGEGIWSHAYTIDVFTFLCIFYTSGFPGGSDGKESTLNVGNPSLIPESGRSPGEGNGNQLQYSCLENSTDRGAWWAIVHGVTKSPAQLNDSHTHTHTHTLSLLQ